MFTIISIMFVGIGIGYVLRNLQFLQKIEKSTSLTIFLLLAFSIVHLLYHEETGKGCEIIPAYIIYEREARLTNQRASLFL